MSATTARLTDSGKAIVTVSTKRQGRKAGYQYAPGNVIAKVRGAELLGVPSSQVTERIVGQEAGKSITWEVTAK